MHGENKRAEALAHERTEMCFRSWPHGPAVAVVICMKAPDRRSLRFLPAAILSAVILVDHDLAATDVLLAVDEGVAATDMTIAVGEVAPPPATVGVDAAGVRDAAEGEIRQLDPTRLPNRRRVVVSLAFTNAIVEGPVVYTVNATLRDARTGV